MPVILLNHSSVSTEIASIHKEGCAAIERERLDHRSYLYGPYESVEAALADYLDEDMVEMGYSEGDIKIHSCTRK